jgi:hypothetical protein
MKRSSITIGAGSSGGPGLYNAHSCWPRCTDSSSHKAAFALRLPALRGTSGGANMPTPGVASTTLWTALQLPLCSAHRLLSIYSFNREGVRDKRKKETDATPPESGYPLPSADGAERMQRLIDEDMKPELAQAEVLGDEAAL